MDKKKQTNKVKEKEVSSADKDLYDITINDRELDEDYAKEMEDRVSKNLGWKK